MTPEHVPPQAAFNNGRFAILYHERDSQTGRIVERTHYAQGGRYVFSLCRECNNETGRRYGTAYVTFATAVAPHAVPIAAGTVLHVPGIDVFPVRVVKQAISNVISACQPKPRAAYRTYYNDLTRPNGTAPPPGFGELPDLDEDRVRAVYAELREFVIDPQRQGLPAGVRLYAHAIANPDSFIYRGVVGSRDRDGGPSIWFSAVGLWPVEWILALDGTDHPTLFEATSWANAAFTDRQVIAIDIPCYWAPTKYPLDFRDEASATHAAFMGAMRREGLEPLAVADKGALYAAAVEFARERAELRGENTRVAVFASGVYVERSNGVYWLDGMTEGEAFRDLEGLLRVRPRFEVLGATEAIANDDPRRPKTGCVGRWLRWIWPWR